MIKNTHNKNILKYIITITITAFIVISYILIVGEQLTTNHSNRIEVTNISNTLIDSTNDSTNDSIILKEMENHKNLKYHLPDKPSYILRLDDVQSPAWSNISIQIINDTLNRNMSIAIGVIPTRNKYDSAGIIPYINTHKNNSHLEITQHGFNHDYYEYNWIEENKARDITMKGLRCIYNDYGIVPVTFIPPNNCILSDNNSTVNTLCDMGFKIISTNDTRYEGNILNAGYNAATKDDNILATADEVMIDCSSSFENGNLSVIMIHPQDFVSRDERTVDPEKYARYLELLDKLNATGAQSITFRDLLIEGEN